MENVEITRYDRLMASFKRGSVAFTVDTIDEFYTMLLYMKDWMCSDATFKPSLAQISPDRTHFEVKRSNGNIIFPRRDGGKLPSNTEGREKFFDVMNVDVINAYLVCKYGDEFNPRDTYLKVMDMEWIKDLYRLSYDDVFSLMDTVSVVKLTRYSNWDDETKVVVGLALNQNESGKKIRFVNGKENGTFTTNLSNKRVEVGRFIRHLSLDDIFDVTGDKFKSSFNPYIILESGAVVYISPDLFEKTRTLIEKMPPNVRIDKKDTISLDDVIKAFSSNYDTSTLY